jgi:hypothetical protein
VIKVGGYVDRPPDELTGRPDMNRHQRKRIRRFFRGVCQHCNEKPLPGKTLCQRHTDMARETTSRWYQKDKERHQRLYGMTRYRLDWIRKRRLDVQARLVVG